MSNKLIMFYSFAYRLPKLSLRDNLNTKEPFSPTQMATYSFPVESKATCIRSVALQQDVRSRESKKILRKEGRENSDIMGTCGEEGVVFVTELPRQKYGSPRLKRQTWNGRLLPDLQLVSDADFQSYSEENKSHTDFTIRHSNNTQIYVGHQISEDAPPNLKTVRNRKARLSKMAFATATDLQFRNFLSLPNFPLRKANSLTSLKSLDSLLPIFQNQKTRTANMNFEANHEEEIPSACQFFSGDKETNPHLQDPLLKRRIRPHSWRECFGVAEKASSDNVATMPRDDASRIGAVRETPGKCKTLVGINGTEKDSETKTFKRV